MTAFLALSWAHGLRVYTRANQPVPITHAMQALFLWGIVLIFLFTSYNKLHIFWIAPLCFILSMYLSVGRRVPLLTPLVFWFTGLCLDIILIGVKRKSAE